MSMIDRIIADGPTEIHLCRGYGDLPGIGGSVSVAASRLLAARMGSDRRYTGLRVTVLRKDTSPAAMEADAVQALIDRALA